MASSWAACAVWRCRLDAGDQPDQPVITLLARRAVQQCRGDQSPFEMGDGAQHLQREHALRCRGVDRVAQAAEMRTIGFELLDDGEQMADRAGEAVEPNHDQDLAGADLAQQARQHRPGAIGTGGVLFVHRVAAGGAQFVELRVGALFLGGPLCSRAGGLSRRLSRSLRATAHLDGPVHQLIQLDISHTNDVAGCLPEVCGQSANTGKGQGLRAGDVERR
jgi:hypothetical protein